MTDTGKPDENRDAYEAQNALAQRVLDRAPHRDQQGRFTAGTSGGGRPAGFRGLARAVREQTENGEELVKFALTVLRDDKQEMRDRMAALTWLGDRGFGRPVQALELAVDVTASAGRTPELASMSDAELAKELLAFSDASKLGAGDGEDGAQR